MEIPGPKKDRFRVPLWYKKQRRLLKLARRMAYKEKQKQAERDAKAAEEQGQE